MKLQTLNSRKITQNSTQNKQQLLILD